MALYLCDVKSRLIRIFWEISVKIAYSEALQNFEYDDKNDYWVRKDDGRAFYFLEKDADDMVKITEVSDDSNS